MIRRYKRDKIQKFFAYALNVPLYLSQFKVRFMMSSSTSKKRSFSDSEEETDAPKTTVTRLSESSSGGSDSSGTESETELEKQMAKLKKKIVKASQKKEQKEFQSMTMKSFDRKIRQVVREEIERLGITRTISNSDLYCTYCKLSNHSKQNCRKLLSKRPRQ